MCRGVGQVWKIMLRCEKLSDIEGLIYFYQWTEYKVTEQKRNVNPIRIQIPFLWKMLFYYIVSISGFTLWSSEFPISSSRRKSSVCQRQQNTKCRRRWHHHSARISSLQAKSSSLGTESSRRGPSLESGWGIHSKPNSYHILPFWLSSFFYPCTKLVFFPFLWGLLQCRFNVSLLDMNWCKLVWELQLHRMNCGAIS